jgi:hypothetical protein
MVLVTVIERLEGRYEAEDTPLFGTAYRWSPECIVIECDCGQRVEFTGSTTTCGGCGTDHASVVRERLVVRRQEKNEATHPWRSLHYFAGTERSF